jgi:hypothetical protein
MESSEPPKKVKLCHCGKPIKYWRNSHCDECLAAQGKEPELKRSKRRSRQPAGSIGSPSVSTDARPKEPVMAETVPNERVSKRGRFNEGPRPSEPKNCWQLSSMICL